MKTTPKISDTEWEVMRVIWGRNPITAAEVIENLAAKDSSWHPKTVRTLLARLVRKKALGYAEQGRSYVYTPLVTESDCVGAASESFVDRVFGGSLRPLLAHFVERQKLSAEELGELRELLRRPRGSEENKTGKRHGKL